MSRPLPAVHLAAGEWLVLGAAALLLLSMTALDWFALSVANQVAPESGGNAFKWLDGLDQALVITTLVALSGPLARAVGIVRAPGRYVAAVTGAAGVLAALLVVYAIVSPPDADPNTLGPYAGGLEAGLEARSGAFVGLALAAGVVAGSVVTIVREPHAAAGRHPHRLAAPVDVLGDEAQQVEAAAPSPSERLSLASASADDLIGVGFTPAQAERIVAYRDEEAIVSKVADLKRVPGIAKPVLAELVKRLDD